MPSSKLKLKSTPQKQQNIIPQSIAQLPLSKLTIKSGIIQNLTKSDLADNVLLCVRWKGGLTLTLSYQWQYYWILVEKDDSIFQSVRIGKEKHLISKLQQVLCDIEYGRFARSKSMAERVAEIVQKRQLTSCMNNTKWNRFREAMIYEMPFCPPYEIKTLFDEETAFIANFIASDIWYQGDYDEEDFVDCNYKIIEYLAVKPKYYERTGGLLVETKILHSAEETFVQLIKNYHIPYQKSGDAYIIYGYY